MADVLIDPLDALQVQGAGDDEHQEGEDNAGHDLPGAQSEQGTVEEEQCGADQKDVENGSPGEEIVGENDGVPHESVPARGCRGAVTPVGCGNWLVRFGVGCLAVPAK